VNNFILMAIRSGRRKERKEKLVDVNGAAAADVFSLK